MIRTRLLIGISFALLTAGCASESRKPYVSPLEFKDYSCNQLAKEMAYTSSQLNKANTENEAANILGTAVQIYGISQGYSFYGDEKDKASEQLKAKYEALHLASIQKDCE